MHIIKCIVVSSANDNHIIHALFHKRKQGEPVIHYLRIKKFNMLGVYTAHPSNIECYYLRMLLHHIFFKTWHTLCNTNNDICYCIFQNLKFSHQFLLLFRDSLKKRLYKIKSSKE